MNNIFDDKAFLMFERADSATIRPSDRDGKAYFVEKDTGRICFLYRFPFGGEKEYKSTRENGFKVLVGFFLSLVFVFVAVILYMAFSYEAGIISNALLLLGVTILLIPFGLLADKKLYKYRFEDYQRAVRNHHPIYVADNKKEEVLKRARKKGRTMLLLAVPVSVALGMGYSFIITANMEYLMLPPLCVIILLMIAPDIKDRWSGWKVARKL